MKKTNILLAVATITSLVIGLNYSYAMNGSGMGNGKGMGNGQGQHSGSMSSGKQSHNPSDLLVGVETQELSEAEKEMLYYGYSEESLAHDMYMYFYELYGVQTFALFYSLEQEFSRFSKTSDLVLLNEEKTLEVSDRFIDVFKKSYDVYNQSNHFFNPLVNIKNIGYSTDFGKGIFEKTNLEVNLDLDKVSVIGNFLTLKENQNLDLGGIVKGYGVDLVSDFLKEKGYSDFIINAGGDIYLYGNNSAGKTPVVGIDSPFNSNELFATLEIKNKSISTSGTYKRKWELENEKYHHILTPETNTNNNEIISITLISDKCYISDSYATACIAMGIEKSLVFLQEKNIDGFLIGSDGNIYQTKNLSSYNIEII